MLIKLLIPMLLCLSSCSKIEDIQPITKSNKQYDELHIHSKYSWVTVCINGKCKLVTDINKHELIVLTDEEIKYFSVYKNTGQQVSVTFKPKDCLGVDFGYIKENGITLKKN